MKRSKLLDEAIDLLGYNSRNLVSCTNISTPNPENLIEVSEWLALEQARRLGADYVYFRIFDDRPSQAQLYIYDFAEKVSLDNGRVGDLQRDVWSAGIVPCIMVFSRDSVRIINTNLQPDISDEGFSPIDIIPLATSIHEEIQLRFSHFRLDSGVFWQEEHKNFAFNKSAHNTLLNKLQKVRAAFLKEGSLAPDLINRFLIQCVLVRYLEEKQETDEKGIECKVFPDVFFQETAQASSFRECLVQGTFLKVFDKLNDPEHLNGKIFEWSVEDRLELSNVPTSILVNLLYETDSLANGQLALWDLYSFRHLPVEVVSSIYEALFSTAEEVDVNGMVYTPPHLAAFLVDEAMPLTAWHGKEHYLVCDPSCGSGVFLVLAFKRMAHWWRLRNNGAHPTVQDLTQMLSSNLYGIDKNPGAVLLTRFSLCLAVCDMLTPPEIWDKFHFPDLTDRLVTQDFFEWQKEMRNSVSFDLLIGNPPFVSASKHLPDWKDISEIVIPQKQIALYFLSAGMQMVKSEGLLCLLLKSSSLLYTTNGQKFRTKFFQEHKVHQIIDLTLLARNHVLWSKEEPDTLALFASKEKPDLEKNILHLVVRRTPSSHVRRFFEIDTYDFHLVPYPTAIEDDFVWKCNLLGGGRLYGLIKKLISFPKLKQFVDENSGIMGEGYRKNGLGEQKEEEADYLTYKPTLPTNWLTENGISSFEFPDEESPFFYSVRRRELFEWPHVVIREVIGEKELYFDLVNFHSGFQRDIVGIAFEDEKNAACIHKLFTDNKYLFRTFIISTSTRCLVYKNTSIMAKDIYNLPCLINHDSLPNEYKVLSHDVSEYNQYLIRRPESAVAYGTITSKNFKERITTFGAMFCDSLNSIYANIYKKFTQTHIGYVHNREFIYTIFQYHENSKIQASVIKDLSLEDVQQLLTHENGPVRFQRILKIYKQDYICFIKPNELRYWMDSIAFRDADGVIADMFENGY